MKKRILLTSGIHGDEPSGPYAVFKFLEYFHNSPNLRKKFKINAIPLINPTGFLKGTRTNQDGKDINRFFTDKPKKDEPEECKILRKFLNGKRYDFFISLHEDPGWRKFYLYDYGNGQNSNLIKKIFKMVKNHGLRLYTGPDDPELNQKIKNGYIAIKRDNMIPALEEYLYRNKIAKKGVCLEIPGKLPLEKKIKLGVSLLKIILKTVLL